jgi:hypothetical protein
MDTITPRVKKEEKGGGGSSVLAPTTGVLLNGRMGIQRTDSSPTGSEAAGSARKGPTRVGERQGTKQRRTLAQLLSQREARSVARRQRTRQRSLGRRRGRMGDGGSPLWSVSRHDTRGSAKRGCRGLGREHPNTHSNAANSSDPSTVLRPLQSTLWALQYTYNPGAVHEFQHPSASDPALGQRLGETSKGLRASGVRCPGRISRLNQQRGSKTEPYQSKGAPKFGKGRGPNKKTKVFPCLLFWYSTGTYGFCTWNGMILTRVTSEFQKGEMCWYYRGA